MKYKPLWICTLLLVICALASCQTVPSASVTALNRSALHDPWIVSLNKGETYHFQEGDLVGSGQFFHSDYAYQTAFLLGLRGPARSAPLILPAK